jgi:hypothetical protein
VKLVGIAILTKSLTPFTLQILKARKVDHRAELFARAIKTAAEIQSTNRKLLLRMRL